MRFETRPAKAFAAPLPVTIDLGDRLAPVIARVNRKARRLIVKVDTVEGVVLVTAPSKRALSDALRFAQTKAGWIRREFERGDKAHPFAPDGVCPYRGVFHKVMLDGPTRAAVRRVEASEPLLIVGGDAAHLNRRLTDWLKKEARREITARVEVHAASLQRRVTRIAIRDQRSRWGSCTSDGALSFSWRLILAPADMLDSVAAHECAHLVHLNHSPAFWRTLASLGVDVESSRHWFQEHGSALRVWGV